MVRIQYRPFESAEDHMVPGAFALAATVTAVAPAARPICGSDLRVHAIAARRTDLHN